ncbi:MAG: aminotransferase class V-fold PLP-dependent enzyme [Rhizobiaceae bacterium]|nr:aminotransferase class V-fold PLP-dependent enzyme [Rhizobiaceae bacterium]
MPGLKFKTEEYTASNAAWRRPGRHFLQIPGPTNTPPRVLAAMARPTIDHRGPEFAQLFRDLLRDIRRVFQTQSPVIIFPASGTGAWEAALVNTLSPGDKVLMAETGHFAMLWMALASRLGLEPELAAGDWRSGASVEGIAERLRGDAGHAIKAVCVVHNETSTGSVSDIASIRAVMDEIGHPALLMVDTISSLGSIDYRHDEWGVDVTIGGSQKGLMLPPGLAFNAVGPKAREFGRTAALTRSYFDWEPMIEACDSGMAPYTPATNLLFGLRAAIDMLDEETLPQVFARHARHAEATRRAVEAWGLEILCRNPAERSNSLTAVMMPNGAGADRLRAAILERYDMSLGNGLSRLKDRVFRIGHLGDLNDLMLVGTLGGIEMGLADCNVRVNEGGVAAALQYLRRRG